MREENIRLQRKLQREMERREALCRQLSESESSLEMDDERYMLRHTTGQISKRLTITLNRGAPSHVSANRVRWMRERDIILVKGVASVLDSRDTSIPLPLHTADIAYKMKGD